VQHVQQAVVRHVQQAVVRHVQQAVVGLAVVKEEVRAVPVVGLILTTDMSEE
jgi:hypothetical protein